MTDVNKAELRRLAEAAQFGGGAHEDIEFSNQLDFHAGCTPAAVLSLLDECDRKDSLLEEYKRGGRCALELLEDADAERDAALAELEAVKANRWVSINDRLPDADGPYWCWFGAERPSVIQQRVCIFIHRHGIFSDGSVTHWMPLAEAPNA